MDKQKLVGIGLIVLVVVAVGAYGVFGRNKAGQAPVAKAESVAKVNGVEIPKTAFDAQLASAITTLKGQGIDTESADQVTKIKTQVLDDLINNELVNQEIVKAGIKVTPDEIQKQYDVVVAQLGGADKLKAQLDAAKLTDEQFRINIQKQLEIQAYLLKNIDIASVTVSNTEISDFYKEYSKGKTDVPPLKDISDQIKQQIIANKQQVLINAFLQTLRDKAQIEKTV